LRAPNRNRHAGHCTPRNRHAGQILRLIAFWCSKDALAFGAQASAMFALLKKHFGHKQANLNATEKEIFSWFSRLDWLTQMIIRMRVSCSIFRVGMTHSSLICLSR